MKNDDPEYCPYGEDPEEECPSSDLPEDRGADV